jgi:hypothetical protein
MILAGHDSSPAFIYRYSSGIGISVSLLAAHIAGCSSGKASMAAILTSEHYLCISISSFICKLEQLTWYSTFPVFGSLASKYMTPISSTMV